jgi:hypothetical protein
MATIKHLVISGGGPLMFYGFNVLKLLIKSGKLTMNTIKSIHATSSGSVLSALLLVNINIDELNDYIIEFPYNKYFKVTFDNLININKNKGLLNIKILDHYIDSVFKTANIDTNITLRDFYLKNNVDFHIYCSELNNFSYIDLNHILYPDIRLKDALYASCALPMLFEPLTINLDDRECCLVDGALFCNNPLGLCMKTEYGDTFDNLNQDDTDTLNYSREILCIDYSYKIEVTSLISYIQFIIKNIFKKMATYNDAKLTKYIENYYCVDLKNKKIDWVELFKNKELRMEIINNTII